MQVVGVAEHYLTADIFEVKSRNAALNCSRRRDIHKNRGPDGAVDGLKLSETGVFLFFYQCEHSFFLYDIVLNRITGRSGVCK